MNNKNLTPVLERINFIERYKKICEEHDDFDNRMRGSHNDVFECLMQNIGYDFTYFSSEHFYRITDKLNEYTFILQLVLKDGIVEPSLNIKEEGNYYFPNGRFDFIPKKMNREFDRKKHNLPKYTSEVELEQILLAIFSIYKDIQVELLNPIIEKTNPLS